MITFLIAGNNDYINFVKHAVEYVKWKKYFTLVYDLGQLGYGTKFEGKVSNVVHKRIPSKPAIILDGLSKINKDDFLVWLDADTLLMDNIDEIEGDYDIGVTVRKKKSKKIQEAWINAGVIFVKNTDFSFRFLKTWIEKTSQRGGDQWALNELCNLQTNTLETISINEIKIKKFSCEIYNNFYFSENQEKAKILHYKNDVRNNYPYNY